MPFISVWRRNNIELQEQKEETFVFFSSEMMSPSVVNKGVSLGDGKSIEPNISWLDVAPKL